MKKVVAVIEKASDGGCGIYCPDITGISIFGYGLTEQEAKENLHENVDVALEYYEEENKPVPEVLNGGKIDFEYRYDFSGFFKTYPFFNITELASTLGINSSLMRKYKNGLVFASAAQRQKIETGIHTLSKQLSTVRF